MHKLFKSKKAVSPVIATVLMIMVVMVGMTLLFAYLTTYTSNYQAGIGSSVMESIVIEDVWFNSTSHEVVQIWVYNAGKVDATINSIYVNDTAVFQYGTTSINFDTQIRVGEHKSVLVSLNWQFPGEYNFKISTVRGSIFDEKYIAPM
jgi:flagellin-like protein